MSAIQNVKMLNRVVTWILNTFGFSYMCETTVANRPIQLTALGKTIGKTFLISVTSTVELSAVGGENGSIS